MSCSTFPALKCKLHCNLRWKARPSSSRSTQTWAFWLPFPHGMDRSFGVEQCRGSRRWNISSGCAVCPFPCPNTALFATGIRAAAFYSERSSRNSTKIHPSPPALVQGFKSVLCRNFSQFFPIHNITGRVLYPFADFRQKALWFVLDRREKKRLFPFLANAQNCSNSPLQLVSIQS